MKTTNLSTLNIHKLTQSQYDRELAAGRIDENALYLTPEEEIDLSIYATITDVNTLNTTVSAVANTVNSLSPLASVANRISAPVDQSGTIQTYGLYVGSNNRGGSEYTYGFGYNNNFEPNITCAAAIGNNNICYSSNAYAIGQGLKVNNGQIAVGRYNTQNWEGVFAVGIGTSTTSTNRATGFRVATDGTCYASVGFTGTGADFAEFFEYIDGNPNNVDRRGLMVTLDGEKVKLANDGDDVIGIVSAVPSFIGDSASEDWQGRYLKDIFGEVLTKEVEVPEYVDEATGKVIPAHIEIQKIPNPYYNPDIEYIPRDKRPEWAQVGLIGKIVAIDDGTCVAGKYCKPSKNGIATISTEKTKFLVMNRIDETHIKVFVGI